MAIFLDDVDYRRFVYYLGDVVEKYEIECWNYCLMPNHYHATLRPTLPNLSKAMKELNGNYAQWWNRRHDRVGHTFQGRFKDQVVARDGYLLTLCRYIARNPVRAGLVTAPAEWEWSSYAETMGMRAPMPFVASDALLRQFGDESTETLRARLAEYVEQGRDDATDERIRSKEWIIGATGFKKTVRHEVKMLEGTPCDVSAPSPSVTLEQTLRAPATFEVSQ
jgi:REP element-mobilizing transposase RayT